MMLPVFYPCAIININFNNTETLLFKVLIEVRDSLVRTWRSMSFNEKSRKGKSPKPDRAHTLFGGWSAIE
jgi:hypothetical protein